MQDLKPFFEKAGLPIEIEAKPLFNVQNDNIFQLTIANREKSTQTRKKGEFFRMYCGGKDVNIVALDADPKHQQVLLSVQEPKRVFYEKVYNRKTQTFDDVRRVVSEAKRKFLVGMDECHLFMSQIPSVGCVNKVKDAHVALKPKDIAALETQTKKKVLRQGEWFFIPVTPAEQEAIDLLGKVVQNKVRIDQRSRSGKPHTPDFLVRVKDVDFVQGSVRHADHTTLKLPEGWHRVQRNTEIRQEGRTFGGWID